MARSVPEADHPYPEAGVFPATLTTDRLVLRPPRLVDAQANFDRYASDPQATRFLSWKTHASVRDTREFLARIVSPEEKNRDQHWAICVAGETLPSGMITTFGEGQIVALGYVLERRWWGQGVMTEALLAVTKCVWKDDRTWRLQALAHVENVGSHRVLEKGGLRLEGTLRRRFVMPQRGSEPQDCRIYAQVRDDLM
ncbi:ribosomal-protein-S5-alanine N-acetyltransferase [Botrimarina colliarenosi]|uniref:Ribosomal-protein-S5-alanine N-acetyltransferase n=1 Tax=Botrimarina colliarenosi TaxID=2528001 RepID=A0A5C6ACH6_9BACT|nr:GNAT family N-acetyltransferase [Botrimarina colliarenosi]TWT97028.1 ribosomal-protein-S5-alanine N-acetyltransferase [Botrimarina colliarenosi]